MRTSKLGRAFTRYTKSTDVNRVKKSDTLRASDSAEVKQLSVRIKKLLKPGHFVYIER